MNNPPCPFCDAKNELLGNALAYGRSDKFPVTRGHLLIIPRRHVADWFDTTPDEQQAMLTLTAQARAQLIREFAPNGFNLGVNVGEAAGQTVPHVHLHLIPRYRGDVANPRGGVRGVIPERQNY